MEELIVNNLGLVHAMAKKINNFIDTTMEIEDMVGYGYIGLLKAARKYDPSLGYKFSTYACSAIRSEILLAIRTKDGRIGRQSDKAKGIVKNNLSYDSILKNPLCKYYKELLKSNDFTEEVESKAEIKELLDLLTEKERIVIVLMMKGYKQNEIASMEKVSKASINQRYLNAKAKMKPVYLDIYV